MAERRVTWTWTNWTFGIYFGRVGRSNVWGIDIGPFEVVWRKPNVR